MIIFRLNPYIQGMRGMGLDDTAMTRIEDEIVANPNHPMIKGLRGVRKARVSRPGMGKRGGGRVVYYVSIGTDSLYMMAAYAKSGQDDLSNEQRRQILAELETIRAARGRR